MFGTSTWACAGPSRLIVSFTQRGRWHLATVDVASGMLSPIAPGLQPDEWIAADASSAIVVAGSDTAPDRVVRIDIATGEVVSIRSASKQPVEAGYVSVPEAIEFPTADGRTAHAFYYAPQNKDFTAPAGEAPPLHRHQPRRTDSGRQRDAGSADSGTGRAAASRWWTSTTAAARGTAAPTASGSMGNWGIVDVADVISAARFLCQTGRGRRRGG